jgi:hypothetical protein
VALGIVLVFGSIIAAFAGATRTADAPDPTVTAQAPAGE